MEIDWQFEQNQWAESLKPWTGDTIPSSVDWTGGQAAAAGLARCEQELEKWQAAKPKNVAADKPEEPAEGEPSKEEWQAVGKAVSSIQECLMERKKLRRAAMPLRAVSSGWKKSISTPMTSAAR